MTVIPVGPKEREMTSEQVIQWIRSLENAKGRESMERFKVASSNALGISTPVMKSIAKEIGKDHRLALALWKSGIFEARCIAAMIDSPADVTEKQMDSWASQFDSWALVDCCCCYSFCKTPFAWKKVREWCLRQEEYVRRAGFSLLAYLAIHEKSATNKQFFELLPLIPEYSTDERNFVKKAVNWALRQVGKRNLALNEKAISIAEKLKKSDDRTARWIGSDALRELIAKRDAGKVKNVGMR